MTSDDITEDNAPIMPKPAIFKEMVENKFWYILKLFIFYINSLFK